MDSFDQAPIATIVEQKLVRWLCAQAGLPASADGTFTAGGSQSNYMGLLLARDAFLKKQWNWPAQKRGLHSEAWAAADSLFRSGPFHCGEVRCPIRPSA